MNPSPVSGRARVASFTVNHQVWVPGLAVPYVFAAVELVEQAELYVFTNIVGCTAEDVRIGMEVEVLFEQHGEIFLPTFQPVNAVPPNFIDTPMLREHVAAADIENMAKNSLMGHPGTSEDIAAAVAYLCSVDARHINGHTLSVNGGNYMN